MPTTIIPTPALVPVTCAATGIRLEACICWACEKSNASPGSRRKKHAAIRRDAKALVGLVAGFLDNADVAKASDPSWGQAIAMATIRDQLKEMAVRLALISRAPREDGILDESEIKAEIEWALLEPDADVAEALIDAL